MEKIKKRFAESIELHNAVMNDAAILGTIDEVARKITDSFKNKGRVFFCGNGGSAADAQHLAAELSGRFYFDRDPLPAEALHTNTSYMTAISNDYSFDQVFSRLIKANGSKGDVLFAISTSGNSPSVLNAMQMARENGLIVIGMTGKTGGKMKGLSDHCFCVPSEDTPRIQELHILIGHIICELVESALFKK